MMLTPGTRLGPYEITARIGVGGMGEVYRATDTNLGRPVAIKVLPEAFAHDGDRLARFDREAKTLAALNHPNIAQIYGLERTGGTVALVMELVEGPTLADRIAQGPISVDEALPIATQIAEALEAAHEQGIIHRDLKPANIKVRSDGTVKVLDFGLAKAMEPASALSPGLSQAPTITTPAMTQAGMILGTAAYMSPEQARGKQVDKRTDIWAFGAVLYEMLTGHRAFDGEDVAETLAAVVRAEPDWSKVPTELSLMARVFLERTLEKNPVKRVAAVRDVALALEGAFDVTPTVRAVTPVARVHWLATAAALLVGIGAGAGLIAIGQRGQTNIGVSAVERFEVGVPGQSTDLSQNVLTVSPDGMAIVYAARDQLYRRELGTLDVRAVAGTTDGADPFFSPDGQWVGFVDRSGNLKRVPAVGGAPVTILSDPLIRTAGWGTDGRIHFGRAFDGLWSVPAAGGAPERATTLLDGEQVHRSPSLIPESDALLFTILGGGTRSVGLRRQRGNAHEVLFEGDSALYSPTGHIVFFRGSALWAVPFDRVSLQVTGNAVSLLEGIHYMPQAGARFAIGGPSGSLAYVPTDRGSRGAGAEFRWYDRHGTQLGGSISVPVPVTNFDLSPDATRLAIQNMQQIEVVDLDSGVRTPVAASGDNRRYGNPQWSPSADRIAFVDWIAGRILVTGASGGTLDVLYEHPDRRPLFTKDWSSSDEIYFEVTGEDNGGFFLPSSTEPEPVALMDGLELDHIHVSPDGRWVAFNIVDDGRPEVYVVPKMADGRRFRVSLRGGAEPRWSPKTNELYFLGLDGTVMSARYEDAGTDFRVVEHVALFDTGIEVDSQSDQYAVSRDGGRILVKRNRGSDVNILVQHFFAELERLVPAR